jgi:hypothetical protein
MWMEDHTVAEFERKPAKEYRLRLGPELRAGLTQCIAAVLAVDPVLELSFGDVELVPGEGDPAGVGPL